MLPKIFILCSTDPYGSLLGSDELSWHRTALFVNEEKIWPRSAKNLEEWRVAVKVFPSLREFRKRFLCFFSLFPPSPSSCAVHAFSRTLWAGPANGENGGKWISRNIPRRREMKDTLFLRFGQGMPAMTQTTTIRGQEQHYTFYKNTCNLKYRDTHHIP